MWVWRIFFVGLAAAITVAEGQLKINVYEGPTECDEVDKVKVGDRLGMHYTGTIDASSQTGEPGTQFASSRDSGVLEVTIGYGDLIEGWDAGLIGICRGTRVILVIPPDMGYGSNGAGDVIPGGATLHFDVAVVSISAPPPPPNIFGDLDSDGNGVLTPEEILAHFRQEGPNAEMPPELMEKDDTNKDGVVSREEFGGPRMPWAMCMEMLYRHSELNALGLAVRWLCHRDQSLLAVESTDNTEL